MPLKWSAWLLCLCGLGCSAPQPMEEPPRSAPREQGHGRPLLRAQLVAARPWAGPGEPLELALSLARGARMLSQLEVRFELPAGVTRAAPPAHQVERLEPSIAERVYRFDVHALPATDLVLYLDARGPGLGYHGELRYRFGRPAPLPRSPVRSGLSVRVAGVDLGPAVAMGVSP